MFAPLHQLILELPMEVVLPRKTKADRKIRLSMNVYRNLHYHTNNDIKEIYRDIVKDAINARKVITGDGIVPPINIMYQAIFPTKGRRDSSNFYYVVEKFLLDALVELGYLPDDDDEYVKVRTYFPLITQVGVDKCVVRIYS